MFTPSTDNTNRTAAPPRPRRPATRTSATTRRTSPSPAATHTTSRRPDERPARRPSPPSESRPAAGSRTNPVRSPTTCTSTQRVSGPAVCLPGWLPDVLTMNTHFPARSSAARALLVRHRVVRGRTAAVSATVHDHRPAAEQQVEQGARRRPRRRRRRTRPWPGPWQQHLQQVHVDGGAAGVQCDWIGGEQARPQARPGHVHQCGPAAQAHGAVLPGGRFPEAAIARSVEG